MRRSYQKYGLINLLTLLAVGAAALAAARYVNSLAGHVAALHLGLGMLVAFVSWFQLRLEEQEAEERLELEDLVICHLGDIGHVLTDEQAEQLSLVDILLVPVGGGPTIDAERAVELIGQLEPSVVIPLQYRTARGDHDREPLERFLRQVGVSEVVPREVLSIKKADLGETLSVVVLNPGA